MKALATFQTYLDEMSAFVMAGDFDAYAQRVSLPFHMLTENASFVIATRDDLQAGFDDFTQTLRLQHVTDLVRLAEGAVLLGEALIAGRYITHILSNANRVVPPFRSQMILRRQGETWRAASIANALTNDQWPLRVPEVSKDDERG
jgi:hypothetical protein